MPTHFDLIITADYPKRTAELRLLDAHGSQLAYRQTDFKTIAVSRQQGLFDLGNYLRHYVEEGEEAASVAEIGVCIAEEVFGEEILRHLWVSESQRTLRIQLPGATEEENHLAAALSRVPWEIARPSKDQPTLGERNLLVRVVHDRAAPATQPLALGEDECLRVLFVFAEARGSRPLAARRERRELRKLFDTEIYPQRRIVAHFLTHGITRERLEGQIQENGGYHIVHWSGHGQLNLLELLRPDEPKKKNRISGQELLKLFSNAGGFFPQMFFLSACHSGDIVRLQDWNDFLAAAQGKESATKETKQAANTEAAKDITFDEQPGYTGTAHALLQGGVPAVVAMRYAVGDEYARDLAVAFYRALLAHPQPKNAAAALTMARRALLAAREQSRYAACDHATPVLYGAEQLGLKLLEGESPSLRTIERRLHHIIELTIASHTHFVGRTWELAELGADFIGASDSQNVKPVAVITGLGGMGKTALSAEALDLWEQRFNWILLYQAKPNALSFENTLRDIHFKLVSEEGQRYYKHIQQYPADAIWREAKDGFSGAERFERLTRNLIRALKDEAILLALDNFETNLKPQPEADATGAEPRWACQDAAWDRCLTRLAAELVGARSRVLLTCRHPLAALAGTGCHAVLLGPLPPDEAGLYLREHAGLSRMSFSGDAAECALAMRLLNASRFHPLLMDRLARLATGSPTLRPQLLQALETLEKTKDFARLPALFTTKPGDAQELAYLNNALAISLDQLLQQASPDARRLLWMIAIANEPVELSLLRNVWMEAPARPVPESLLRYLTAVGLVTEERAEPDDSNAVLSCHELVRERIRARMEAHSQERAGLTENSIRLGYAEQLAAAFEALQHRNMTAALQAGSRALVYCVQAEAYDRLVGFARGVVTRASDPRLLEGLLPHLEAAAESAPEGQLRWHCLGTRAVALMNAGRHDTSLPFYEQAAAQARIAAEATESGSENAREAWSDVGSITGNWAKALLMTRKLDAARQQWLESAEAKKKAGRPAVQVIATELEALRIDIRQDRRAAEALLPKIEARLAQVEKWWRRCRSGQRVPEAPDLEDLACTLISALDVARQAHFALKDWEPALRRIDAILEVEQALKRTAEDIAATRVNRASVLGELGRFGEARAEWENCLQVFQHDPAMSAKVLSGFATLFRQQGDVPQAITQVRRALALCEHLPDPMDRVISHNNLANNLERSGTPPDLAEAPRHQLAALVYRLVAGLGQSLQVAANNYVVRFRRAYAAGTELAAPRVAELLADPAFHPLKQWLSQRNVDVDELQAKVDQFLEMARQLALERK